MTLEGGDQGQGAREEEASLLVGRIIRRWATLEDYIDREIGSLQMTVRMRVHRLPRQWYPQAPGDLSDLFTPDFRQRRRWPTQSPDRKWKLKLGYFKRLCLALMHGDSEFRQVLDRLCGRLHAIFIVRNDIAHGGNWVSNPWEEPGIRICNQDWQARYLKQAEVGIPRSERCSTEKFYSFRYLTDIAAQLSATYCDLQQTVWSIPSIGEICHPLPTPPRK